MIASSARRGRAARGLLLAALVALACAAPARAASDEWPAVLAGGLGLQDCLEQSWRPDARPSLLAISPHDPALVLACGLGRSEWGGAGWQLDDAWRSVAFSPRDPRLAFAVDREERLLRSTDRGASWSPVEGASEVAGLWTAEGGRLYVLAGGGALGWGLFAGSDAGGPWQDVSPRWTYGGQTLVLHPGTFAAGRGEEPVLYAGGDPNHIELGLFRSRDGGVSWRPVSGYMGEADAWRGPVDLQQIALHPDSDQRLYVLQRSDRHELWLSGDGGERWQRRDLPGPASLILPSAASPGRLLAASEEGLWRSEDEGQSWETVEGVTGAPLGLVADPSDPNRVFYLCSEGSWRSVDGGLSWARAFDGRRRGDPVSMESRRLARSGPEPGMAYGLLPAADGSMGVHRSADGGWTWQAQPGPSAEEAWIVGHPTRAQTLAYIDPEREGFWLSEDGGRGWDEIEGPCVLSELVFAADEAGRGAFASCRWGGIAPFYKSEDGGRSWIAAGLGLPEDGVEPGPLAVAPSDPARLYQVDETFGTTLHRSADAARSWQAAAGRGLEDAGAIMALAVSPVDAEHLLALGLEALHESRNGGEDWTVLAPLPEDAGLEFGARPWQLSFLGASDQALLLAGPGLHRSGDGGRSWRPMPYPGGDVTAVAGTASGAILALVDGWSSGGVEVRRYQPAGEAARQRADLPAGGALASDRGGARQPLGLTVTSPNPGPVAVDLRFDAPPEPGLDLLPFEARVELPAARAAQPAVLVLRVADEALAGAASARALGLRWSGEQVPDCLPGLAAAVPAPCVFERWDGDGSGRVKLRVLGPGRLQLDRQGPLRRYHQLFLPKVGG